ncbi:unnamed protein product [Amoebophrya sp. A25]|nr:unnamed protein product [Amoebophrya sp. A25]|eukprot:GSA25T00006285001.1
MIQRKRDLLDKKNNAEPSKSTGGAMTIDDISGSDTSLNIPFVHGETFISEDAARGYTWDSSKKQAPQSGGQVGGGQVEQPTLFRPFGGYTSALPFHHFVAIDASRLNPDCVDSTSDPSRKKVHANLDGRYMLVYVSVEEAGRFAYTQRHALQVTIRGLNLSRFFFWIVVEA